jgi:hypothetical protein
MNTGAILNRINFGMAAAAGRLPGVNARALPALDTIGSAPREKQVDAVVATVLNGMVSPDTRAVLLSGDHPLLANGAGASGIQNMSQSVNGADTEMSDAAMDDSGNGQNRVRGAKKQNGGGKQAMLQGRGGLGNIPQLGGLPQMWDWRSAHRNFKGTGGLRVRVADQRHC